MPAKNAAAPAAPKNNAKGGEKPAAPKDPQAKGGQKQAQGRGKAEEQAAPQATQNPAKPLHSDPEKAAIQRKLNDLDAKISKHRAEEDKLKNALDAEKAVRDDLVEQNKKQRADITEFHKEKKGDKEERSALVAKRAELFHAQKVSKDEAKKIRERLPTAPIYVKTSAKEGEKKEVKENKEGKEGKEHREERVEDHEAYLRKIDDDIRLLEKALSSSAVSLAEEKKKVEQISQLQKAKKTYKEYVSIQERIANEAKAIAAINKTLDESSSANQAVSAQTKKMYDKSDAINTKIDESRERSDKIFKDKQAARERINKDFADLAVLKKELEAVNIKIREKEREKDRKEYEEREKARQKRREDNAAREEKRAKEEEVNTPFEYEMDTCKILLDYLNSLVPKEEEEAPAAAPTTQTIEGATVLPKKEDLKDDTPKNKRKDKRRKPQDMKHNVSVFQQFELLSLTPPMKVADIEASVAELKAKNEHYSKQSAAQIAARKEAAKSVKPADGAPSADTTTTTTTTTTPTEPTPTPTED